MPTELQVKCLQKVQAGELWFEKALTDSFLCARRVALTQREGQLVSLLSQGLKNKEIATTLMISEGTVKVHLKAILKKIGAQNRTQAAIWAHSQGMNDGPGAHARKVTARGVRQTATLAK